MTLYTFDTYKAEIDYRSDKIRRDVVGRRRARLPFVRRPAATTRGR